MKCSTTVRNPVCFRALLWPIWGGAKSSKSLGICKEVSHQMSLHLPGRLKQAPYSEPHVCCPVVYSRGTGQAGLHSGERKGGFREEKGQGTLWWISDRTLQFKRIPSMPCLSFLTRNPLKTQSLPLLINPSPYLLWSN